MQLERSPIKMSQLVALRFNRLAFETPLFQASEAGRAQIFQEIRDDIIQSTQPDDFVSWGYIDQLRAALVMTWLRRPWQGAPVQHLFAETVPGDIEAEEWMVSELVRRHAAITTELQVEIFGHCPRLWQMLQDSGLHIDAVHLIGQPGAALEGLRAQFGAEEPALPDGLHIAPLRNKKQVEAVVELQRSIYTDEPQLCWYGATLRSLNSLRIELRRRLVLGGELSRLLLDGDDKIVGYFGARLDTSSAYWGAEAHLNLLLAPAYRGRRLSLAGYRFTLQALVDAGAADAALLTRATHPAVLSLGAIFGHRLHAVDFRRQPLPGRASFGAWVP